MGPNTLRAVRRAPDRLRTVTALLVLAACLVPLLVAAVPAPASAAVSSPGRAMWVWSNSDPEALVSFAGGHGVGTLFVAVGADVATSGDLPRLQRLAVLARDAGIRVDALGGDPSWTTDHKAALAWLHAAVRTGLFAGVHLDVEPYALAGWAKPRTRASLVTSYLNLLSSVHQELETGSGLPLEADVPFWYDTIPAGGGTLADAVLARVDAVTAMTYRDTVTGPDSITGVGADILARGAAARRPVRLAAEVNPLPDCPYCTFHEEGAAALEAALSAVDGTESGAPAYAGIAIEDYDGWRALPA